MKKRGLFYLLIVFCILIIPLISSAVSPINPGHNSSQVYISYSGGYVSLQKAIDNHYLLFSSPSIISSAYTTSLPTSTPYHLASQILLTSNGYTMTLQEAITYEIFAKAATASHTTALSAGGENAANINVDVSGTVRTLQYLASNPSTLCFSNYTNSCGSSRTIACNGSCSCSSRQGTSCTLSATSEYCVYPGSYQCDDSCSSYYIDFGTQPAGCTGSSHACDGSGNCVKYSGTGCASCPFGVKGYVDSGSVTTTTTIEACALSYSTLLAKYYYTGGSEASNNLGDEFLAECSKTIVSSYSCKVCCSWQSSSCWIKYCSTTCTDTTLSDSYDWWMRPWSWDSGIRA